MSTSTPPTMRRSVMPAGVVLVETIRASGLDAALSAALRPWRKPLAVHDPAKMLLDLAMALAVGGDCLADVNLLRAEPRVYGSVASDPTISRLIDCLADDVDQVLAAIETGPRCRPGPVWALAGEAAADHAVDASQPGDHRPGRHTGDVALG